MSSVTFDTTISSPTVNPFAKALVRASLEPNQFSLTKKEKIILGTAALFSSLLTLGVLVSATLVSQTSMNSLSPIEMSRQASSHQGNDEASLASYFLSEASALLSSPSTEGNTQEEAALLLTQAKQQLALLPQDDQARVQLQSQIARVESSVNQLASNTPTVTTLQQIGAAAQAPETASVQTVTTSNTHQGTITFKVGSSSLFVPYAKLADSSQLYLKPETATNDVLYVQSRVTGKGFTVASTSPVSHDVSLTWYEIIQ